MIWSLCYLLVRCLLQLALLRPRPPDSKELEIVVLRHELNGVKLALLQAIFMGRAGIEPATLGLKVRLDELKQTA